MNYCPRCKLRVPAEAAVCPKCGGAARTVGAGGESGPGAAAPPSGDLALQLAGLRHEVRESRKQVSAAATLAALLFGLFVVLLIGLHLYDVFQYAQISGLQVTPADERGGEATIAFERQEQGKVEFIREAAGRVETLVDHGFEAGGAGGSREEFTWSGGEKDDYALTARFRSGWSLKEERWKVRTGQRN